MEEELTREEDNLEPAANKPEVVKAKGDDPIVPEEPPDRDFLDPEMEEPESEPAVEAEDPPERDFLEEGMVEEDDMPPPPPPSEEDSKKALQSSIGIGLPSDRYRVILPKGSFPPLSGRQQFIARLRDKDRVSFRIFMGDEELASQNEFLAELGMVGVALNNDDKAFLELHFNLNLDKLLTIRLLDKFGEKEALIILDMARKPKVTLHQDKVLELMDKLDSIENRVEDLGGKITALGGTDSKRSKK